MALVGWLRLSLDRDGASAAAAVLLAEDFDTVPALCCPHTGPNRADLESLFPEQRELVAALLQAIEGRQTLETWLRQRATLAPSVAASACEVLQREDFKCPTDLVSAALTREDVEDLFPNEPDLVTSLLAALASSAGATVAPPPDALSTTAATAAATAAASSTCTSTTTNVEGPIECWLRRQQLHSLDVAACASAFEGEGFTSVSEIVSAALTRADLEELFPNLEDQSTVAQLFGMLSEHGVAVPENPTPTEAAPTTLPAPETAVDDDDGADSIKAKPQPAKRTQKRVAKDTKPPMRNLPLPTLRERPPISSRILVQFADTSYPGTCVSHGTTSARAFDVYFEVDQETWTLDAGKNNFCFHDDGDTDNADDAKGKEEQRTDLPVKKKLKKQHKRQPAAPPSDSGSDSDTPLSWTGQGTIVPTGFPPRLAAPRPKQAIKHKQSSPKLATEDHHLATEPSVHRVIVQYAPLYSGDLHMLNRKLQGHIATEQPPKWKDWESGHIQTAIDELLHFDIARKCFTLKESFLLFLTKDEAKNLRYKRGIFKDEDPLTKSSALSRLTLPSKRTIYADGWT